MKSGKQGFARLVAATGYSIKGIRACWRHETAFRQEVLLTLVLFPASFFIAKTTVQWLLLIGPVFLLLMMELLNSAIEAVVDRIGDEHHELSGRAKDVASAPVMLCLFLIAISWATIAWTNFA